MRAGDHTPDAGIIRMHAECAAQVLHRGFELFAAGASLQTAAALLLSMMMKALSAYL